jgi:hypothetical protein
MKIKPIKAGRIMVPTFEITARPTVKWSDLNVRRYPPLSRAKDRLDEVGVSIWPIIWEPDDEAV